MWCAEVRVSARSGECVCECVARVEKFRTEPSVRGRHDSVTTSRGDRVHLGVGVGPPDGRPDCDGEVERVERVLRPGGVEGVQRDRHFGSDRSGCCRGHLVLPATVAWSTEDLGVLVACDDDRADRSLVEGAHECVVHQDDRRGDESVEFNDRGPARHHQRRLRAADHSIHLMGSAFGVHRIPV